MKILFKDLLNKTMDVIRKYTDDELIRKIVDLDKLDLNFTISITNNSIDIFVKRMINIEDSYYSSAKIIDTINIYKNKIPSSVCCETFPLMCVIEDWTSVRLFRFKGIGYYICFSEKYIDHVFTDDDVRKILKEDPSIRFVSSNDINSIEYMDENGIIDTDILDDF